MKFLKILLFTLICSTGPNHTFGQNQFPDVDPKWDNYYNNDPSGIEKNFKGLDFIRIIELVDFNPQSALMRKDVQLMKKMLLMLDEASLRQMMINGRYYCRTFKHDDYFALYNLYYNKVEKAMWDKYCPYLLVLMDLDDAIKLGK